MKLKELIVLTTVGCSEIAGGCTSPDPEDAKHEMHPVCAVPDARGEVITKEMVDSIRLKCREDASGKAILVGMIAAGSGDSNMTLDAMDQARGKKEEECFALHGLGESEQK